MMSRLFFVSTAVFWLAVLTIWTGSATPAAPVAPKAVAPMRYTLAELGQHSTPEDCWMAIGGKVYDVTAYLPDHPSAPRVILPWCGKDADQAYRTKTRGRPHSVEADRLLRRYFIGELVAK